MRLSVKMMTILWLDVMASGDDSRTDKHVDHESMAMELRQVLDKVLKDREKQIVCACFGIGETEKGLEEIGDKMGLTRERVRQIREKSITKLRDSGNVKNSDEILRVIF